jgi:hypothetical protein
LLNFAAYWAALVAAPATVVMGLLWYSLLFARPWMGCDPASGQQSFI